VGDAKICAKRQWVGLGKGLVCGLKPIGDYDFGRPFSATFWPNKKWQEVEQAS